MSQTLISPRISVANDDKQRLGPRTRFGLLASITVTFLAGSSVPTPLYPIYQDQWHFTAMGISFIFSIYAISVLAGLLVFGRLSDYVGRRSVLLWTTVLQLVAMYMLGVADGFTDLVLGRLIQGVSTGAAVPAVGAALIDLNHKRGAVVNALTPAIGSAVGALMGSVFAQALPYPTHTVFAALAFILVIQGVGLLFMRDIRAKIPGAARSLIPQFSIPVDVRGPMIIASSLFVAGWAVAGFFASMGPRLIEQLFALPASWAGGLVLAAFAGSGVAAIGAFVTRSMHTLAWIGALGLLIGMAMVVVSLITGSLTPFVFGVVISGAGFGAGFQGGIRLVLSKSRAEEVAGVLSVAFLCCYLGMGVPAMIAGYALASGHGIFDTAIVFAILVMSLSFIAVYRMISGGSRV